MKHRNNLPFIVNLKREGDESYSYALNLNQSFSITNDSQDKQSEEAYLHYNTGIGLPKYPSFLLANFANKLHHSLPKTETVKTEEVLKSL